LSIICRTYGTDKQYDVQLNSSGGAVYFLNGKKIYQTQSSVRERDKVIQFN